MRHISPLDLRRSLGAILDAASAGERFLIERDRRPLAMLVSVEEGQRLDSTAEEVRERRRAALDAIDEYRRRMSVTYPAVPDAPGAAQLMRQERSRDDPDGHPEYASEADG